MLCNKLFSVHTEAAALTVLTIETAIKNILINVSASENSVFKK